MTSAVTGVQPNPEPARPLPEGGEPGGPGVFGRRHGSASLRVGAATLWLSVIVLLPCIGLMERLRR